eukprot:4032089-Alexandrium_andersonii.AAC.1
MGSSLRHGEPPSHVLSIPCDFKPRPSPQIHGDRRPLAERATDARWPVFEVCQRPGHHWVRGPHPTEVPLSAPSARNGRLRGLPEDGPSLGSQPAPG